MKRALANLIDNALKHYRNKILISLEVRSNIFNISVEDDGEGLNEKLYNDVFRPFLKVIRRVRGMALD